MICALSVVLPAAFVAGIAARQPVAFDTAAPWHLARSRNAFGKVVWTKTDLWPEHRILTSLRRNAAGEDALEFVVRELSKPDVLVYWMSGNESMAKTLPDTARLLGALVNRATLPLPSEVRGESSRLILYSLAEHEVVAASTAFMAH